MLGGILFLIGMMACRTLWKPTVLGKFAHILVFGGGLLWFTAGFWPADVNEGLHLTAWLWLLLAEVGLIMSYAGLQPQVPKIIRALGLVIGVTGIFLAFAFLAEQYFGLGRGIAERLVGYSVTIWSVLLSGWIIKVILAGQGFSESSPQSPQTRH